jgi:hypothetical protein
VALVVERAHGIDGRGRFTEIGFLAGVDLRDDGRSVVAMDLEGDGDADLLVKNLTTPPVVLRNDFGRPEGALALRLRGPRGNPRAIGARITVLTEHGRQLRDVTCGGDRPVPGDPLPRPLTRGAAGGAAPVPRTGYLSRISRLRSR